MKSTKPVRGALMLAVASLLAPPAALAATWLVATNGNDANPGTQAQPFRTIGKGIAAATHGDTVQVGPGRYAELITWQDKNLNVQGAGTNQSIIDGLHSGSCLTLVNLPATARLEGFTIQNGRGKSGGGGILNVGYSGTLGSRPTVVNCDFRNNDTPFNGGAIYNGAGGALNRPTVINCAFSGNSAYEGGAIFHSSGADLLVVDCSFNSNAAIEGGGGLRIVGSSSTVSNSSFVANSTSGSGGGGISLTGGSSIVTRCSFSNNTATGTVNGGGMRFAGASPMVTNCTFTGNRAWVGGGIYSSGSSPTVVDCSFAGNVANSSGGGIGGSGGSATVRGCTFRGNAAGGGGGMNLDRGNDVVTHCTFIENSGSGLTSAASSPTVAHCVFSRNSGRNGGGMLLLVSGSPSVMNCLFAENTATVYGGGMATFGATSTVVHCTFSRNGAGEGGGMRSDSGSTTVNNCILWENTLPQISGGATVSYSDVQGGYVGSGNLDADPLFASATTGNYHLKAGSPCLDAASAAVPGLSATDLDDVPRIQGGAPDMGAYEFGSWFVDKSSGSDLNPGDASAPFATVTRANTTAANGHSIYVKQANYGSDRLRMTKALRLFNWGDTGLARIGAP